MHCTLLASGWLCVVVILFSCSELCFSAELRGEFAFNDISRVHRSLRTMQGVSPETMLTEGQYPSISEGKAGNISKSDATQLGQRMGASFGLGSRKQRYRKKVGMLILGGLAEREALVTLCSNLPSGKLAPFNILDNSNGPGRSCDSEQLVISHYVNGEALLKPEATEATLRDSHTRSLQQGLGLFYAMHAFAPDLVLLTSSLVDIRSLYNPAIASNASEVELLQQSITAGWLTMATSACHVVKAAVRRDTIVGLSLLQPSSMLSLQNTTNLEEEQRAKFEQSLMTMLEDAGRNLSEREGVEIINLDSLLAQFVEAAAEPVFRESQRPGVLKLYMEILTRSQGPRQVLDGPIHMRAQHSGRYRWWLGQKVKSKRTPRTKLIFQDLS